MNTAEKGQGWLDEHLASSVSSQGARSLAISCGIWLMALVPMIGTAGCSLTSPEIPNLYTSTNGEKLFIHRVEHSGENFRTISLWYTGSALNEDRLRTLNPQLGTALTIGDFVAIPATLLFQSEQLPKAFVTTQGRLDRNVNKSVTRAPKKSATKPAITAVTKETSNAQREVQDQKAQGSSQSAATTTPVEAEVSSSGENSPAEPPQNSVDSSESDTSSPASETLEDELLKNLLTE